MSVPHTGVRFRSPSGVDDGTEGIPILGRSPVIVDLVQQIRTLSRTDASVLIEGDTGVGKSLVARTLHRLGPRASRPFVALNSANLSEELFESELFGHVRGSFSGAYDSHKGLARAADTGTLFIDEVGELAPASQAKLLGFLDHQEVRPVGGLEAVRVDLRIIAATNRDLEDLARSNGFRRDLYYRLRVLRLRVPRLAERGEDIALLAEHFLRKFCRKYDKSLGGITREAMRSLEAHPWDGNVRELENEMERAVILTPEDRRIEASTLALTPRTAPHPPSCGGQAITLRESRQAAESQVIRQTLEQHRWNVSAAARILGISRVGLTRKLKNLGIHRPGHEPESVSIAPSRRFN